MTVSAEDDVLRAVLGPARDSHADEYDAIRTDLENSGVEIDWREGQLAYSPAPGGPGRMILDPDASIAALRHEYRHYCDIRDAGFPGLAFYYRNPMQFARLEVRGYLEEIRLASEFGDPLLVGRIVQQMKTRVRELLGIRAHVR